MPAVAKDEAVARLTKAVEQAPADDLVEIYNELFPGEPISEEQAHEDVACLVQHIADHIYRGLEVEEVLDLWHVVFPTDRNVHYDEETATIHYNEDSEPVRLAEWRGSRLPDPPRG